MKDARVSIFVRGIIPRLIDRNLIGSATSLIVGKSRLFERNHAIIPLIRIENVHKVEEVPERDCAPDKVKRKKRSQWK